MHNNEKNIFFFYPEVGSNQPRKVIAGVFDEESNTIKIAKSECSIKDRFCKSKGRAIALSRALCNRPIKEKQFIQKGNLVRTNRDLLPSVYHLELDKPVLNQFINIAKTI